MTKKNILITALSLPCTILPACRKDNKTSLAPATCDTTNVSFATIKPVFTSNCTSCHVELNDEKSTKEWFNFPSIMNAIKHENGYLPMPQGGPKLSDCEIRKIEAWYNKVK